jgi:hypothetical protein
MINLRNELTDQVNMITRRLEWMAAQAMLSGKVTVSGENYPSVVVDFGRNALQSIAKAPGSRWSDPGVNPLDDLQDWSDGLILKNSGASATDVVMTVDVWKVFRENPFVKARWNSQNEFRAPLDLGAKTVVGGQLKGQIDGFMIWVYSDWYVDPADNTEKPMLPPGTVLLGSEQIQGARAFGAIRDEEAGFQSMPYFPKSWVEKDPSVRYLLTQSAPLVVPYRPDASLCATVL